MYTYVTATTTQHTWSARSFVITAHPTLPTAAAPRNVTKRHQRTLWKPHDMCSQTDPSTKLPRNRKADSKSRIMRLSTIDNYSSPISFPRTSSDTMDKIPREDTYLM